MKAGKFKESDLVTVGNDAWATGNPVFKGSSLMFLKPGMQVPVSQLIRGIMPGLRNIREEPLKTGLPVAQASLPTVTRSDSLNLPAFIA